MKKIYKNNGEDIMPRLEKFYKDRERVKILRTKLKDMFYESNWIQNPCTNNPSDFLVNVDSYLVKQRVAWFGSGLRAALSQVYAQGEEGFIKTNHDVALPLVIMSGRWRAHAQRTMQSHLNVSELIEIMGHLKMGENLLYTRLNELEEAALVQRIDSLKDKRTKLVMPTEDLINQHLIRISSQHLIAVATRNDEHIKESKNQWAIMGYDMDLWYWAIKTFSQDGWGQFKEINDIKNTFENITNKL